MTPVRLIAKQPEPTCSVKGRVSRQAKCAALLTDSVGEGSSKNEMVCVIPQIIFTVAASLSSFAKLSMMHEALGRLRWSRVSSKALGAKHAVN